jgi:hypothetical protein
MCESLPLTASVAFALQISLGLALAESALFFFVWRLEMLVEPSAGRQSALAFILLGSVVTLQAMVVVGIAWAMVAVSRTTVDADEIGLTLEHPWRRWHGDGGPCATRGGGATGSHSS